MFQRAGNTSIHAPGRFCRYPSSLPEAPDAIPDYRNRWSLFHFPFPAIHRSSFLYTANGKTYSTESLIADCMLSNPVLINAKYLSLIFSFIFSISFIYSSSIIPPIYHSFLKVNSFFEIKK